MTSQEVSSVPEGESKRNSTFTLQARKWDRELVCAASNPLNGESYNATVILNVQCKLATDTYQKTSARCWIPGTYRNKKEKKTQLLDATTTKSAFIVPCGFLEH